MKLDHLASTRGVVFFVGVTMGLLTAQTALVNDPNITTLPLRYVLVALGGLAAGAGILSGVTHVGFVARRWVGGLLMAYSIVRGAAFGWQANSRSESWWGFATSTALTVWLGIGLLLGFVLFWRARAEEQGRVGGWESRWGGT